MQTNSTQYESGGEARTIRNTVLNFNLKYEKKKWNCTAQKMLRFQK